MTQRGTQPEMLRGVVEATNERGIKLDGRWLNYSQFRQVTRAETGQEVEVEVVRDRFINALTIVGGGGPGGAGGDLALDLDDGGPAGGGFGAGSQAGAPGGDAFEGFDSPPPAPAPPARGRIASPAAPAYSPSGPAPRPVDRNTEIRRLALIKAAADFAASRPKLAPEDVVAVAREWEKWIVEREGERPEEGQGAPPGERE
jgi:hypothetical protein